MNIPQMRTATGTTMPSEAQRIQATLAHLVAEGADPRRVADKAAATWRDIDVALSPIIGKLGVAALFKRSLYLSRTEHPWLAAIADPAQSPGNFEGLREAMMQQTSARASAANSALLLTFHDLLTSLIGDSLTERLLRSVRDNPPSGDAVQDTSP